MNLHWQEYVKNCYDLVIETEHMSKKYLPHEAEAYVVHLMANSFKRVDIGAKPVAIMLMEAIQKNNKNDLAYVGSECLLIQSFPLKMNKWPSENYYVDMGTSAFGLAGHIMEKNFKIASEIMRFMFNRKFEDDLSKNSSNIEEFRIK